MGVVLLDADVAVDLIRGHPTAVAWEQSLAENVEFGIVGYAAMELLVGCRNKLEMRRVHVFIDSFAMYWPNDHDRHRAIETLAEVRLTHGIGIIDTLIAETAIGLGVPLFTFNTKHFDAIANLVTEQPYKR